jgi:hypothetical protein
MSDPQLIAGEYLPTRTEADAVHEQTLLGIEPQLLAAGRIYAIRTASGIKTIDLTDDRALRSYGMNRLHPVSSYAFHDIVGFCDYANGILKDPSSLRGNALCMADEARLTIRLIFDAQPDQWADVYADLKLQKSPEAERWIANSGKYQSQQDFAEFCELNLDSFVDPPAASILEIAQTFQAKTTVDFASAVRLSNGAIKLKREEQITATAGERSDLTIPEKIRVAFPLFKYDKNYQVHARLRYRMSEGAVKLSVLLVDPDLAIEHAFRQVVSKVSSLLEMPIFYGRV